MILFAEAINPVVMVFIAAVAVVTWLLLSRSQRYFSQRKGGQTLDEPALGPIGDERGHHLDVPDAAARWEVEMHDTARELSAQLDSKMSALQALIADADRAAARLEAALGRSPAPVQPLPQRGAQRSPQGVDVSASAGPPPAGGPADRTGQDLGREEIYTLADYGFEPAEIASRVGRPIGEVQLILGLRGKK